MTNDNATQNEKAAVLWIDPRELRSRLDERVAQCESDIRSTLDELLTYFKRYASITNKDRDRRREQLEEIEEMWSRVLTRIRARLRNL